MRGIYAAMPCWVVAAFIAVQAVRLPYKEVQAVVGGIGLLEMLSVHSGAFIGGSLSKLENPKSRVRVLTAWSIFYGLFTLGAAWGMGSAWVVFAYAWLAISRFFLLADSTDAAKWDDMPARSAFAIFVLIFSYPMMFLADHLPQSLVGKQPALPVWAFTYFVAMGFVEARLDRNREASTADKESD